MTNLFCLAEPTLWYYYYQIWIAAVKQRLKSAVYFWPGSEVNFNGKLIIICILIYNEDINNYYGIYYNRKISLLLLSIWYVSWQYLYQRQNLKGLVCMLLQFHFLWRESQHYSQLVRQAQCHKVHSQSPFHLSIPEWDLNYNIISYYTHRPQFIAAYFDEPDHSGHQGGPFSDLVRTDCM
jgi:hypothetical protein